MFGVFRRDAHWLLRIMRTRGPAMKPLWTQTIVWIAAVLAAFLLAFASPDGLGFSSGDAYRPQGGMMPR